MDALVSGHAMVAHIFSCAMAAYFINAELLEAHGVAIWWRWN
jgi:hypothetical protein